MSQTPLKSVFSIWPPVFHSILLLFWGYQSYLIHTTNQCCVSRFIESGYGSGSSISSESGSGYRSGVWWPKIEKKYSWNFSFLFLIKNCNLLSPSLHKWRPRYRRSFQPFKTWNFLIFFYSCGSFLPSWIWIRIHWPDWIRIQSGSETLILTFGGTMSRRDRPVGGGQRQRDRGLPAHQPARQEYSQECARHSVPRPPPLPRQVAVYVVWVRSVLWNPVLRIRDVYPGSRIPDLNFFHQPARQEYSQECARHSVPRPSTLPRQVALRTCGVGNISFVESSVADPGFLSRFPDPNISYPDFSIPEPHKIVSMLSKMWSGLFIPDPDPDFYLPGSWIQVSKRHRIPDTDPQH